MAGLCDHGNEHSVAKNAGISWISEQVPAAEDVPCFVELKLAVSFFVPKCCYVHGIGK